MIVVKGFRNHSKPTWFLSISCSIHRYPLEGDTNIRNIRQLLFLMLAHRTTFLQNGSFGLSSILWVGCARSYCYPLFNIFGVTMFTPTARFQITEGILFGATGPEVKVSTPIANVKWTPRFLDCIILHKLWIINSPVIVPGHHS